ncbi:ubiquitin-like protein ATG12 isoform X1 [Ranitomeya variabilis]|uniref:ubiquitin-like protein ATG12 isoform X1 n=1 Tax=Ranitomeya variabilis TaxID=490064 RepID=UPI004055B2B9
MSSLPETKMEETSETHGEVAVESVPAPAASPATEEPLCETRRKIDVLLKAVGDTPIMKNKKWTIERTRTVQGLMDFIKKYLKLEASEQMVLFTLNNDHIKLYSTAQKFDVEQMLQLYLCQSIIFSIT